MPYRRTVLAALSAVILIAANVAVAGASPNTDSTAASAAVDTSAAIVLLQQQPLATYDGHIAGYAKTHPSKGKLNPNSAAYRSYLGYLKNEHSAYAAWLRANVPSAQVTSDFYVALNGVAVKLNGNSISRLKNADVSAVQYNWLYHPDLSESYKIIDASGAWSDAGGRATAGAGIKIGDVDTGIDQSHPFFDPTGFSYPSTGGPWPKCDALDSTTHTPNANCEYVTPKVIVAKVFYNKAAVRGLDAQAVQDHGTHTAGIAAGIDDPSLDAVVKGVSIGDMSGVAPGAWLGNYNVFPGQVENARSEDILNAVDAAIADGMDVLNLSLGGTCGKSPVHATSPCAGIDPLALGLDNAVDAGVVVAVAAGNSGPGAGTVESPGRAPKVITAGASTNDHFVGEPFTYPSGGGGTTIGAAVGQFPALPTASYNLFDTHSTSCTSVSASASGKLAIINRGTCTFSTKVRNAHAAGAVGVVVINNVAGDPTAMAKDGLGGDDYPAVMIGLKEGAALRGSGATTADATASFSEFITTNADILAGFSSQGPTNVDLAIKPDLTSVGVNVLSSITCVGKGGGCPGDGTGWAFFSGTSMATPHIAGSAAVLLDLHPSWTPAQVKSALVNRADLVVTDSKTGTHDIGPTAQGAGRENLSAAADGTTWMNPVSASFGRVPVVLPTTLSIQVFNPTGSSQSFDTAKWKFTPNTFGGTISSVYDAGNITAGDNRISVPSTLTIPANSWANVTVTVHAGLAPGAVVQGWITLTGTGGNSGNDLHFAYWALVGP